MVEDKVKKKKNIKFYLIIVIVLVVLSSIIVLAWARFSTTKMGGSSADVAKWVFKVNGSSSQTEDNILLAITRTDSNRFSRFKNDCTRHFRKNRNNSRY